MSSRRKTKAQQEIPPVRRAYIPPDSTYETMSDLGRELYDLSREYEKAGETLLSEEEIGQEITRRRGGYLPDEFA